MHRRAFLRDLYLADAGGARGLAHGSAHVVDQRRSRNRTASALLPTGWTATRCGTTRGTTG